MKKIKRILTLLISGIMALTPLTALAAVETPTVTYTNSSNDSPDLYVTKITQDEYGNVIDAGDTEFEFTVKVNDSFYKNEEYRVFNSDGDEVFLYDAGESTDGNGTNKRTFKTDRNGDFTLKSGQTARFEWVGTGNSYEVYENTADGWTQIFPAGGDSATGTITATGNTVEFINIQSTGSSQLIVYKTTSFPDGYDAPETPEFTFNIYLRDNGNPAPYEYTLKDIDSGRSLGTTWTDSDGNFTLQGGQYAVFDVPQDVDYKVYEVTDNLADGWRVTSEESFEGTTGTDNSIVLDFNNATASFAVSKKVTDTAGIGYDSDHEFTFLLTDAEGYVWPDAEYYLYHTNGMPYYDEDGNIQTGETDENGYFTLKENQTAIFYGIDAGTGYSVSEVKESEFTQVVPNNADGYTDKEVHDTTEVLPFTNSPVEMTGNLVVTKTLDYSADEDGNILTPEDNTDEFYYILYEEVTEEVTEETDTSNWFNTGDDDNPIWWKPVEGAVYSVTVGNSTYTYKTGSSNNGNAQDRAGGFTLNANTSAVFSTLSVGKEYLVLEESWSGTYSFRSVTVRTGNETTDNEENNDETADNEESNGESVRYGSAALTSDGIAVDFVNTYNQELPTTPRLPSTGGRGVMPYVLFGTILAGCAMLMFYAKKKREIK